jgi:serine protease inhibitor
LKTVFNDPPGSANFSKIAAPSSGAALELSDVIHETTLTVNEEGTIAAAITEAPSVMFGTPEELWINRPFFFAVQHIPTGACILLGHVVDPRENPAR